VFAPGFVNYTKGCTLLATASDKVYQLLSRCLWFSPPKINQSKVEAFVLVTAFGSLVCEKKIEM
jgi:hypothetical protein